MAQFEFEVVNDSRDQVRGQGSLVVDTDGNPHVVYTDASGQVVVASRNSGTWRRETLFGRVARFVDEERVWLQLDSAGQPHVAWIEQGTSHLLYGVRGADFHWSFTPVPSSLRSREPDVVAHLSFLLRPAGQSPELGDTPHFIFEDQTTDALAYARFINGAAKLSQAAAPTDLGDAGRSETGQFTSMMFDASSLTLRTAYVETIMDATRLHVGRILDVVEGTPGGVQTIAETPSRITSTSIVARDSHTWVAYGDFARRALEVAFIGGSGEPAIETVDSTGGRAVPSLAFNPALGAAMSESPAIAYSDVGQVKLARRRRLEGWTIEAVGAGTVPSLAFDRSGHAHLWSTPKAGRSDTPERRTEAQQMTSNLLGQPSVRKGGIDSVPPEDCVAKGAP